MKILYLAEGDNVEKVTTVRDALVSLGRSFSFAPRTLVQKVDVRPLTKEATRAAAERRSELLLSEFPLRRHDFDDVIAIALQKGITVDDPGSANYLFAVSIRSANDPEGLVLYGAPEFIHPNVRRQMREGLDLYEALGATYGAAIARKERSLYTRLTGSPERAWLFPTVSKAIRDFHKKNRL